MLSSEIRILPNVDPWRYSKISTYYDSINNISLTSGDSHMMKNMEWGAGAYLSHSKYGINKEITINNVRKNTSKYIRQTGCAADSGVTDISTTCQNEYHTKQGQTASTTGNIYGIYDMAGSVYEYTMGVQTDNKTLLSINVDSSGFTTDNMPTSAKYYDMYTYNSSNTAQGRGKLGDATKETVLTFGSASNVWYSDHSTIPYSGYSWFRRGGDSGVDLDAGIFSFNSSYGSSYNFGARAVLVRTK